MKKYSLENHLLKKVMLLFITLLVPLIAISFFAFYRNNQNITNETLLSIHEQNKFYINQLDDRFRDTYYNNFHLLDQSSMLKLGNSLSFMGLSDEQMRVSLLREQLSSFCITNPMIESAHAYFLGTNIIYHSKGYSLGSYSMIESEEMHTAVQSLLSSTQALAYHDSPLHDKKELSLVFRPTHLKNYNYGLQLCFSTDALLKHLKSNNFYENDFFLYTLDNGFTLSSLSDSIKHSITDTFVSGFTQEQPYYKVKIGNKYYYAFYYELDFSSGYYIRLIDGSCILDTAQPSFILMACFFGFIICIFIVFFVGINRMLHRPLKKLTYAFEVLEQGDFSVKIETFDPSDFSYLFHAFNNMSSQLEKLIEHGYNQKILLQKAELKQLQAQINPHFLYNSFFMLQRMIRFDAEQAQEMANALAIYFQYITRNSMEHVPLTEEYKQAKSYTYIQGLRYTGRIEVFFDELPDLFSHLLVPKLILQPILENAFDYGLKNKIEGGILRVTFEETDDSYLIHVEDNGDDLSNEKLVILQSKLAEVAQASVNYEMTGILNIQRRLTVFLSSTAFLTASRSDLGGLCLSIIFHKE